MENYSKSTWHYTHLLEYNEHKKGSHEQTTKIEFRSTDGNLVVSIKKKIFFNGFTKLMFFFLVIMLSICYGKLLFIFHIICTILDPESNNTEVRLQSISF